MSTIARLQRGIFTYIRSEATDGPPPTPKAGESWYDPDVCVSRVFSGAVWEYFALQPDATAFGVAGYMPGGRLSTSADVTSISRMFFATEFTSLLSSGLSFARDHTAGCSAPTAGYAIGGYASGSNNSRIDKLIFVSDTVSSIASNSINLASCGYNSQTNGYTAGYGGVNDSSRIGRLVYTSDSFDFITSTLSLSVQDAAGFQSSLYGYISDGFQSGPSEVTRVERMNFSTEATNSLVSGLTLARGLSSAFNSTVNGYITGGGVTPNSSRIDKLDFSTDSISSNTSSLSAARITTGGFNSKLAGYTAGGSFVSTIERLTFSSEAVSTITSGLSASLYSPGGFENLD